MRGFTILEAGEPIVVGDHNFCIGKAVGPDKLPLLVYPVTCPERPKWRYIAKTPEEAQAFVHGFGCGLRGEVR